jgi:site-specific DNA-cytosine methylase
LDGAIEFPKKNIPNDTNRNTWIITDLINSPTENMVHPNLVRLVNGIRNKSTIELGNTHVPVDKTVVNPNGLISFGRRISPHHGEIVDPDQPSKTIICAYGMCPRLFVGLYNPTTDTYWVRPFTITELAQIQAFPKNYRFHGTTKEIITQIGNAVPSNIISSIVNHLSDITFESHQQQNNQKILETSDIE